MNRQWMKAGAALLTLAALGVTAGVRGSARKEQPGESSGIRSRGTDTEGRLHRDISALCL